MKRIVRDTGILLAFCGAFYLLTVMVNRLEGDTDRDDSDFSSTRRKANELLTRKDWGAAEEAFRLLTEKDPYNGYAWECYSTCIWEIRRGKIYDFNMLDRTDLTDPAAVQQADELSSEIEALNERNKSVLLQLKRFARYRFTALLRLANLECDRGDHQEALDYLEEFVGRGYQTRRGLHLIEQFGSGGPPHVAKFADNGFNTDLSELTNDLGENSRLHVEPRFWDIVRRERAIPINL